MKRVILLVAMTFLLVGCADQKDSNAPEVTATHPVVTLQSNADQSPWNIYDPSQDHLWNRVFRQLYRRVAENGQEYGLDELDPLLWFDTTYLLTGDSYQQTIQILDEFLSAHAEDLIHDPLRRAMFQRDMWAVFDWLASQPETYSSARRTLEERLAQIIRRVALPENEILSLPDNYALEIASGTFPTHVPADQPDSAFLPPDIFQPDSAWVPIGREGGPIAMTHTESFPFFGRSVFLVYIRQPNGRNASLDFIDGLNAISAPILSIRSDVALVRRMLLIDNQGKLIISPLVETLQIRHFNPEQHFHEFELSRMDLLGGLAFSLALKRNTFMLFMSHGDVFVNPDIPELEVTIPQICTGCHFEDPPFPKSGNIKSIISYSRQPFALPDNQKPTLFPTTLADEARTVITWKQNHETWKALENLWNLSNP